MSALEANRTRRDGGNDVNDSIRTLGACAYTRFYECQDPLPACRLGALQWSVRSLGCGYETALQSRRCSGQMAPPYTEVVVAVLSRQARKKRSRDSSGSGTRPWSSCSRALRFSKSSDLRPVNWSLYFRRCWKTRCASSGPSSEICCCTRKARFGSLRCMTRRRYWKSCGEGNGDPSWSRQSAAQHGSNEAGATRRRPLRREPAYSRTPVGGG